MASRSVSFEPEERQIYQIIHAGYPLQRLLRFQLGQINCTSSNQDINAILKWIFSAGLGCCPDNIMDTWAYGFGVVKAKFATPELLGLGQRQSEQQQDGETGNSQKLRMTPNIQDLKTWEYKEKIIIKVK